MNFPSDFTWGVATASYQIEGSATPDGIGKSVWDMFCEKPNATLHGHNGDVACDHFNRYKEDIDLMKNLGVSAYRLSISWPRVMPTGKETINQAGLDFYNQLIDEILSANIQPWVTLFHWDFPLDLYHQGGWMNPESPEWFAAYTDVIVKTLGDRVSHWFTENEPQCFIGLGLQMGVHAPGDKLRWDEVLLAAHNSMIAHGRSVQTIREHQGDKARIGIATVGSVCTPATNSPEDIAAARTRMFTSDSENPFTNTHWNDPIHLGHYPDDFLSKFGDQLPKNFERDLPTMHQPVDFIGLNIYQGSPTSASKEGPVEAPREAGFPQTAIRWPINDGCLEWGAKFYYERYNLPIYITESGMANNDWVMLDGKVHDPQRIDYLHRHLLGLKRTIDTGTPVKGYFQWSFMDNFEWAEGYTQRFGIVHVDYATQKRTPKDSYYWYRDLISGKINLEN